ncbi:MAG: DUF885 domain-containing protein [Acidobacteria bacterium]|nr:DUF885 domain-containing protein [Acidobacteriota bacterium]
MALNAILLCVASAQDAGRSDRGTGKDKSPPGSSEQSRFEQLVAQWMEDSLRLDPVQATILGIHKYDDQLGDFSAEGFRTRSELAKRHLSALESIPVASLSPSAQADYRVLQGHLKVAVKDLDQIQSWKRMPSLYSDIPTRIVFLMASREYAPLEDRLKNIIARMRQIPEVLEAARRNLNDPPRIWTEIAIDSTGGSIEFFDRTVPVLAGAIPPLQQSLALESRRAADAFREHLKFLKEDLLPRSGGDFKAGKENFEYYLKNNYLLEESSDQLLALGRMVFDRTRKQVIDVAKLVDSGKDWKEVLDGVKRHHPSASTLMDEYRREVARARAFLLKKDLVAIPADEKLQIIETPVFQRGTVPYAQYYSPAPYEKDQTGYFTVTPVDTGRPPQEQEAQLSGHSHGDIVNTAVHEAYPGHHLQFLYSNRSESTIKKILASSIFSEGWGLYSEELLSESGYYSPEERLIQLQWTLVRAARVLIDVGLHTGSMSFDDAVAFLTDEVRLDKAGATAEVRRYTMNPTQPLSYLVGRELIFRIRDDYARKQGKKYKLKNFHAELLGSGAIPPPLIRELMQRKGLLER